MSKDPLLYLDDIVSAAQMLISRSQDMSPDYFFSSPWDQAAANYCFVVIGEAALKIPRDFKEQHPEVPWRRMEDMRHVMAHHYDDINPQIVWDTIRVNLPSLVEQLREILATAPPF